MILSDSDRILLVLKKTAKANHKIRILGVKEDDQQCRNQILGEFS
jgi:hypothetical protein